MIADDDIPVDDRPVRAFFVTGGRVASGGSQELELEALVSVTPLGRARHAEFSFERHAIVGIANESISIAEISAHLSLPMLSTVLLVTQLVDEGILAAQAVVHEANIDDLHAIHRTLLRRPTWPRWLAE